MLYHKETPIHNGNTVQEKASFAVFAIYEFIKELEYIGYQDEYCKTRKMLIESEAFEYMQGWANSF